MHRTPYSILTDKELLSLEFSRDARSWMEIELAQRLQIAMDYISDLERIGRTGRMVDLTPWHPPRKAE